MDFQDYLNNKYDLLFFPRLDFSEQNKENEKIITYFIKKNHRVFYCNLKSLNNRELKGENKKQIIVNFEKNELHLINEQLDKVIKKDSIRDCVIIVDDPGWQPVIIYLKKKYGFKVIFYYSEKASEKNMRKLFLFKYDDMIFKISDEIIIFSPRLYDNKKIKNNKIRVINTICTGEYIENLIKKIYGLVSIVIVTFNNLRFTKQCIASIFAKTAYPNYEILVVDNCSQDGTVDYLIRLKKEHQNVTVILNEENAGFARANNIGIRYSKGEYIILINNDTVVTKGWVTGLVKHLDRDEMLGLVGPVTNGAWTESKIHVNYSCIGELDTFAEENTIHNFNKLYTNLRMLPMFCIAMKRKIIEEIGYLDESFGIGMFEDDDYSYRVKLKGYKIACAEDVFIHHYVSASFNNLPYNERWNIFYKNKEIYEKKWNTVWQSGKPRD